jgi:energy-coupling factor transport system ATP-binding protein
LNTEFAIILDAVSFQYRRSDSKALSNINLRIRPGSFVGVIGPNGAGKSTLVSTFNRIVPKMFAGKLEGRISVFGQNIDECSVAEMVNNIGMVFQDFETQLFSTSVRLEAAFVMENLGMPREHMEKQVAHWLDALGLSEFADCEPMELSGGRKQRLALASVLAADPKILILDEPTTDLDPVSARELSGVLKKHSQAGETIICVTHDLESLIDADEIYIMDKGEIVDSGSPSKILADANHLTQRGLRPPQLSEVFSCLHMKEQYFKPAKAFAFLTESGYRLTPMPPASSATKVPGQPLLHARDLSFGYRRDIEVLHKINLSVAAGEFVAILGQNGCGKTTLLRHLAGIEKPWSGRASIGEEDAAQIPPEQLATQVGMIFQNPDHQIFCPSCLEEVAFGLRNIKTPEEEIESIAMEALRVVGLASSADADPFAMTKGDRKKLAVASVLACRPRILLLDEPTTGLDAAEQQSMMEVIQKLVQSHHAVIFVTHCMDLAVKYADRFVVMANGRIILDGDLSALVENEDIVKEADLLLPSATALGKLFGGVVRSPEQLAGRLKKGL